MMMSGDKSASPREPLPADFLCPACGYDLSGARVERCSECGYTPTERDVALRTTRARIAASRLRGWLRLSLFLILQVGIAAPQETYARHPELLFGVIYNFVFFLTPVIFVGWWAVRGHGGVQRRLLRKSWLGVAFWVILPFLGVAVLSRIRLTIDPMNEQLSTVQWSGLYALPTVCGAIAVFAARHRLWRMERRRLQIDDLDISRRRFTIAIAISCAIIAVPPLIGVAVAAASSS